MAENEAVAEFVAHQQRRAGWAIGEAAEADEHPRSSAALADATQQLTPSLSAGWSTEWTRRTTPRGAEIQAQTAAEEAPAWSPTRPRLWHANSNRVAPAVALAEASEEAALPLPGAAAAPHPAAPVAVPAAPSGGLKRPGRRSVQLPQTPPPTDGEEAGATSPKFITDMLSSGKNLGTAESGDLSSGGQRGRALVARPSGVLKNKSSIKARASIEDNGGFAPGSVRVLGSNQQSMADRSTGTNQEKSVRKGARFDAAVDEHEAAKERERALIRQTSGKSCNSQVSAAAWHARPCSAVRRSVSPRR